jgi:glycosyltransferase involved in cell wall biosynthesis
MEWIVGPPRVAVVIPVYNREESILRAVYSVLGQTFCDFEMLVVDDGSTDRTVTTLIAGCNDSRLRLLRHDANRGAAAARNTAIRATQAEFVAFLDSDDEWDANKLELQLDRLDRASADTLVCCTGYWMVRSRSREVVKRIPKRGKTWRDTLHVGCVLSPGSTAVIRRRAFDLHGLFDERLRRLEDWDWLLRYSARNDLIIVEEALARVHVSERMNATPVDDAARIMNAKHGPTMRQLGHLTAVRFKAALLLERAASSFYAGQYLQAIGCLTRSLILYPVKPTSFFAALVRRTARLLWSDEAEDRRRPALLRGFRAKGTGLPQSKSTSSLISRTQPSKPEV